MREIAANRCDIADANISERPHRLRYHGKMLRDRGRILELSKSRHGADPHVAAIDADI